MLSIIYAEKFISQFESLSPKIKKITDSSTLDAKGCRGQRFARHLLESAHLKKVLTSQLYQTIKTRATYLPTTIYQTAIAL